MATRNDPTVNSRAVRPSTPSVTIRLRGACGRAGGRVGGGTARSSSGRKGAAAAGQALPPPHAWCPRLTCHRHAAHSEDAAQAALLRGGHEKQQHGGAHRLARTKQQAHAVQRQRVRVVEQDGGGGQHAGNGQRLRRKRGHHHARDPRQLWRRRRRCRRGGRGGALCGVGHGAGRRLQASCGTQRQLVLQAGGCGAHHQLHPHHTGQPQQLQHLALLLWQLHSQLRPRVQQLQRHAPARSAWLQHRSGSSGDACVGPAPQQRPLLSAAAGQLRASARKAARAASSAASSAAPKVATLRWPPHQW